MANSIKETLLTLQKQALGWTITGAGVLVLYPVVILNWDTIKNFDLLLPFGVIGIAGTIAWWFWTMSIIFHLLKLRREEAISFEEILKELKSIRSDLQKNPDKN